jgi:spore coat protein CotH
MDKVEKRVFQGLFVLSLVLVIFLAIAHERRMSQGSSESDEPFIKDRVVTVRIVMDEKSWQRIMSNPVAKEYERADFWFDGQCYPNVAVRAKGNSSLMSVAGSGTPRMSFKVDFNFFNFARTFRGIKKICLNNGFSDPTLIRETIGYEVFEQMGFHTSRTAFVDLYINDLHLGLYTQVEQIDKTFLARHFSNPNGNLYKPEVGAAALNWTKADLDRQIESMPESLQKARNDNLAINIGGARLRDLLKLMQKEGPSYDANQVAGDARGFGGRFPGGPGGGFPGGPGGNFPGGPGGPFGQDANEFRARSGRGFPFGPGGPGEPLPQDANEFQARSGRGFPFGPGGPGGPLPQDANEFRARGGGGFPFGPGGPGEPLHQDANEFRARGGGGFPFGPGGPGGPGGRGPRGPGGPGRGGPFGRGGNLLETMGLRTNENYQDHTALFRFLDVLNNCPNDTFPTEIEKVLDVDQVLRYFAVSVMIVHLDNYIGMCHNFYLYEMDGKFTILPWDLNMAFGGFNMGMLGGDAADYYIDQPVTMTDRPLAGRLFAYKPYLDKYHQYLEQMLTGCFAEGLMESRIDELAAFIRPYVEADTTKSFTMEDFEKGLTEGVSRGGGMMRPPGMRFPLDANTPPQMDFPSDIVVPGDMRAPAEREQPSSEQAQQEDQNRQRRSRGFGRLGPGGPTGPGLKAFLSKRRESVRKQLDGELPSKPDAQQLQQAGPFGPMMPPMGARR